MVKLSYFQLRVTNVKLKNIKIHLKLLTGKLKKKILYTLLRWPIGVTAKPKSYGKTKKRRQNKKATTKQKSHGKTKKLRRNKKATAKQKLLWQNKKATAKQKCHGKTKMPRQIKKATAK